MGALAGRRSHFVLAAVMSLLFGCSTMRKLVLDAALVANVILTSISRRLFSDRFARYRHRGCERYRDRHQDNARQLASRVGISSLSVVHTELAPRAPAKRRI